jgi:prepilin-type N-terminal cleavage/methylation domain-containing protein
MKGQNILKKAKGFTLVELLVVIAIIGLLAVIGIPAILNAQRASRNTTRLKQLEAVRNALADYYTKYNTDSIGIFSNGSGSNCSGTPSGVGTVYVAESGANCARRITVQLPQADGYLLKADNLCTEPSKDKIITYKFDPVGGTITLCKEPNGEDMMQYK